MSKYDGCRAFCYLEPGRCRLISRNGNQMHRFAGLSDQIAASLDVSDAILDGEIIATDETGRPQFYDLLRDTRAPAYVAFDLLWLNGADLRALPLSEHRRQLQSILPKGSRSILEPLSVTGRGHRLFELMRAHDLEGIVANPTCAVWGWCWRFLLGRREGDQSVSGRAEPIGACSDDLGYFLSLRRWF